MASSSVKVALWMYVDRIRRGRQTLSHIWRGGNVWCPEKVGRCAFG